jgi:hypothetical protein
MSDPEMVHGLAVPRRLGRRPQAARYANVSEGYLEKAAVRGDGPPYIRVSARLVLYDFDDLDRGSQSGA